MKKNILCLKSFAFIFLSFIIPQFASAQTFPSGFSQVRIAQLTQATAMGFAPDGRLFICQRGGTVRIYKNGTLLTTPFISLTVDQNGERGISGITFDPNFSVNKYIYIYYTATTPTIHNRLSRFTANGDVVQAGSEVILLDGEPVASHFHNGGGLGFGPDGKLYLAMGEDNKPSNSQSLTTYKGKLLRINSDGSAPADNPYSNSTNAITKKIWCLGLRNPYTMAFESGTGKLFVNNVGADSYEEIHNGTLPNKNFGWPTVEGSSTNPAYDNPVFSYPHTSTTGQRGCAITGGVFFKPVSTNYPAVYNGKYFYMDYCNGWIYYLNLGANNTYTNTVFATGLKTKNLALQTGPDGNLYYLNRDDVAGGVYKILYTNNNAPIITSQPSSATVSAGQPVTFSVSASGAQPLVYQWRKNGTSISGATSFSYVINSVQSSDAAQYSVRVSNNSGTVTSNSASLTVTEFNASPTSTILTPTAPAYFRAGDVISFSGDANDPEDGNLPASAFEWELEFHHNNDHFHPGQAIPAGVKSGTFQTSNSDHTTANVFYRLKMKVTDTKGLSVLKHIDIFPITSSITLNTQPPGLQVTYGSQPVETPFQTLTVEGLKIQIGEVSPQTKNGTVYAFDHWVHGGAPTQTITVGPGDSSYTAVYVATGMADYEMISAGAQWKYLDNGSNQGTSWRNNGFSDAIWKTGNAQLGYGDGDEVTVVGYGTNASSKFITTYFRKTFSVTDATSISNLELHLKRDDGAVVYLNGSEVYRSNMPSGAITYTTLAPTFIDGTAESAYVTSNIDKSALINGVNTLAVEIHQNSRTSSDISFDLKLKASTTTTTTPVTCSGTGMITREYWNNFTGTTVSEIPVNSAPTGTSHLTIFEGPTNSGDNYGARIRGYICPPQTGNYRFWIASDNSSELWLSTNDQPAGKVKIADVNGYTIPREWTKYPSQQSALIPLTANTKYYVEVLHREGTSGDNVAVGWQLPDQTMERPMPGNRLSPYGSTSTTPTPSVACDVKVQPMGSTTFCQGGSVMLTTNTGTNFSYQWIKNGDAIIGANSSSYTASTAGDYQVKITGPGCTDWSAPLRVTINTALTAKITIGGSNPMCSGGSLKLYANTCGGYNYQWRKNSSDIPGATSATYVATSAGEYQVKIFQGASVAWSAKLTITEKTCEGQQFERSAAVTDSINAARWAAAHRDFQISVFPNPTTGLFTLEVCLEDQPEQTMTLRVVNNVGVEVFSKPSRVISGCVKEIIELSGSLPTGIYILQLNVGGKSESIKVLLGK